MGKFAAIVTVVLSVGFVTASRGQQIESDTQNEPLEITFIANEGVLVSTPENTILIDALFDTPNPEYEAPPLEMLEQMGAGSAPFDKVDLVLITHNHGDHFSPDLAARFMESTEGTMFMAAADTVSALRERVKDWEHIRNRVMSFDLTPGGTAEQSIGDIDVKIFRTLHSGDLVSPQNLMYLIRMDDRTIFHEGDSDGKLATFQTFGLEFEDIDLALVHFWFPLSPEGEQIINGVLKPDHTGLIHLPIRLQADAPTKIDMVKSHYNDLFLFLKPGEKRIIH